MKLDLTDVLIANQSTPTAAHPLLNVERKESSQPPAEFVTDDPLQASSSTSFTLDFVDPLGVSELSSGDLDVSKLSLASNAAKEAKKTEVVGVELETGRLTNTLTEQDAYTIPDLDPTIIGFTPWRNMKEKVLAEFTATDQLSIESSFLSKDSLKSVLQSTNKSRKSADKDVEVEAVKLVGLSQVEYENKIRDFHKLLQHFWSRERRIECIALAVEVARLLRTVSVPQYYPSVFIHVTDFLDVFGNLVYQRLLTKAKEERKAKKLPSLPAFFSSADILEETRITARNWFGKIQEIKEVLPRVYVQLALLRCMQFVDDTAIMANLMRMGTLARSLQHPLVSNYARCFICRVSMRIDPVNRSAGWLCLNDWMQTYTTQPVFLLWPALEYIIQCVSYGAVTYNDLLPLWEYCALNTKRSIILISFLNGVSRFYLAEHATEATKLVTQAADEVTSEELCALGKNLCLIDVDEKDRKQILRSVWKCINMIVPVKGFLMTIDVWIEFVCKYFTATELGIILDHVIRVISPNKIYEHHYQLLASILSKIMDSSENVIQVFELDTFVRFIDLFRKDSIRKETSSIILTAFVKKTKRGSFTDLKLAYQIIELCKKVHDSVTMFSTPDEVRMVFLLVQGSLDRFAVDMEPERALEFLIACRAAMMNVDGIQKYVVVRLLSLSLNVVRKSRFSTARAAFLHSCVANLFITIPSIRSPVDRIRLMIQTGQTAMASETFLFLDSILQTIVEDFAVLKMPADFQSLTPYFVALLITVPDPMDSDTRGPLNFFANFIKAIKKYSWPKTNLAEQQKGKALLACVQGLLIRRRLYDRTIVGNSSSSQFKWIDRSTGAKNEHSGALDECLDYIANLLAPILKSESSLKPEMGLELVEIVAKFSSSDGVVDSLAELTKESYKKCKKIPGMQQKLKMAKQGVSD